MDSDSSIPHIIPWKLLVIETIYDLRRSLPQGGTIYGIFFNQYIEASFKLG
jgi:hypothetical protein